MKKVIARIIMGFVAVLIASVVGFMFFVFPIYMLVDRGNPFPAVFFWGIGGFVGASCAVVWAWGVLEGER